MINNQITKPETQKELLEQYLAKIAVQSPYFALTQIYWNNETGIITAAEAGRHLAILGSCGISCLNTRPGRHYYLAYQAQFSREDTLTIFDENANYLYGVAKDIRIIGKREAQSTLEILTPQKNCIGKLVVNYHIVNSTAFERIYKQYRKESINHNIESPFDTPTSSV